MTMITENQLAAKYWDQNLCPYFVSNSRPFNSFSKGQNFRLFQIHSICRKMYQKMMYDFDSVEKIVGKVENTKWFQNNSDQIESLKLGILW